MPRDRDATDAVLEQWGRERPDLDRSGMGIVLRVQVLAGLFSDHLKAILAPAGLAPWEFEVLSALRRAGARGGVSSRALCVAAQLTSGAMTHRLDRLEERGLLRRRASATDRRTLAVCLTPKGRGLIDRVLGARMDDAAQCIAPLGRQERRDLARLLRALTTRLTEEPAGG